MYHRVTELLRAAGWEFKREGKGHAIWWNPVTRQSISVPRNLKKTGTANGILKRAGLPKEF